MNPTTDIGQLLQSIWGHSGFRPMQEEAIRAVLAGKDTVCLLPTGGGKSICYQLPTLAGEGNCLVITPLIALMQDQVQQLQKRGIAAQAIFSGMGKREIDLALDNVAYGKTRFLYLSPERLQSDIFKARVAKMRLDLIAVDEAHCISQWGYDFRPDYLRIGELRELVPEVPMIALTATATERVRKDIVEKLALNEPKLCVSSFARENLHYIVRNTENKREKLLEVLRKTSRSCIVYARTRKRTRMLAELLQRNGMSAQFYHAGLNSSQRSARQQQWMNGELRIITATNAFGMGIDKGDVEAVVHYDMPESLEAYYQEAGRAGRDGRRSFAVLLYNQLDLEDTSEMAAKRYPPIDVLKRVYQALADYLQVAVGSGQLESYNFDLGAFCQRYSFDVVTTRNALLLFAQEGWLHLAESVFVPSRARIVASREEVYRFQVENRRLDPILKMLLRSTSGLFEQYCTIDEKRLAKSLDLKYADLLSALDEITRLGIIDYQPKSTVPQLTFLLPRAKASELYMDHARIANLKANYLERVEAMFGYAISNSDCRQSLLLRYFGEEETVACGRCDFCMEQQKEPPTADALLSVRQQIETLLKTSALSPPELVAKLQGISKQDALALLRSLLDEKQLGRNAENKLTWLP